jgi:hypothetical protein
MSFGCGRFFFALWVAVAMSHVFLGQPGLSYSFPLIGAFVHAKPEPIHPVETMYPPATTKPSYLVPKVKQIGPPKPVDQGGSAVSRSSADDDTDDADLFAFDAVVDANSSAGRSTIDRSI